MKSSAVGKIEVTFKKKKLIFVKQTSRDTCMIFFTSISPYKKIIGPWPLLSIRLEYNVNFADFFKEIDHSALTQMTLGKIFAACYTGEHFSYFSGSNSIRENQWIFHILLVSERKTPCQC
jgi:hypothetical protein